MGLYENHVFPRLCDLSTRRFEEHRREIIASASGRVLEIGVGTGNNLPYYSRHAEEVVAIEISAAMMKRAMARAATVRSENAKAPRIAIHPGDVTNLEFDDDEFDTVVSFLVFCSIPDPARAAAEIFRVLTPGGRLLVFEHVAAETPRLRAWQDRLNPMWRFFACGCNINRETRETYQDAGFDCTAIRPLEEPHSKLLSLPIVHGTGIKPLRAA